MTLLLTIGSQGDVQPFVALAVRLRAGYGLGHMLRFCRAAGRRAAGVLPALGAAADGGADVVVHHPVLPLGG